MNRIVGPLCILLLLASEVRAQDLGETAQAAREWATPGERGAWFAPTQPEPMGDYMAALADSFANVELDTLAWIEGGEADPDSVLPVLLLGIRDASGADPSQERLRVLILAGQRGDDLSGPEIALQVSRELIVGELQPLLDDLELAVVPAENPWGLLWWIPEEPSGVDLARDHMRMSSAATGALHRFAARWRPHVVIELREASPAVYRVQAGLPRHPNVDPDLASFGRFYLLPYVANELIRSSVSFREQVAVGPDAEARGTPVDGADGLEEGAYLTPGPLGADRARNAFALGGGLSVMLSVASLGGAEGMVDRVQMMYQTVGFLLEVAAAHSVLLRERVEVARVAPDNEAGLAVRYFYVQDEQHPELVWLVWNERGQIVTQTTDRWRSAVRRQLVLPVPAAWVIEPEGREWAELIASHGFAVERIRRDERIDVASYPIGTIGRLPPDLADELPLDAAPDGSSLLVRGERPIAEGAWLVRADQPGARLLFTLIEPWSQDTPLSREAAPQPTAANEATNPLYPVHRVEAGTSLGSLRTEPAELGPGPGPGNGAD